MCFSVHGRLLSLWLYICVYKPIPEWLYSGFYWRMMEMVVTNGAIKRAKLQPNRHHQQTNAQNFTGHVPFLSPQPTVSEHWKYHTPLTCSPSSPWVLPTLSMISKCCCLPWRRVATPLLSPLTLIPLLLSKGGKV